MNQPGELPSEEFRNYVRRNETWNFWVNVGDISFFRLGTSFVFMTTILPLYVSNLTESKVLIGLIPAVGTMAYYLPQIFTAAYAESLSKKKPWILRVSTLERLPYLVVGATAILWPVAPPMFSYILLLIMMVVQSGAAGITSPAWYSMLATILNKNHKGMMFGFGTAFGSLMGAAGTLWARHILDAFTFPISFGLCFLIGFFFLIFSYCCLVLVREPDSQETRMQQPLIPYLRKLPNIVQKDKNFMYFLLSQWFAILGTLGFTFYILYGQETFKTSVSFGAIVTFVALFSQAIITPIIGKLGDHFGHRFATIVSVFLSMIAGIVITVAPNKFWLLVSFGLLSTSTSGLEMSRPNLTIDLGFGNRLPTYLALSTTLLAIPTLIAPVIGGWLIEIVDFRPVFILGIVFSLLGLFTILFKVKEPRKN